MKDKKGVMRVVEATIAVTLILTTLIFLSSEREYGVTEDIGAPVPALLDEIARNLTFREELFIDGNSAEIKNEIKLTLSEKLDNPSLNVSVEVCNANEVCFLQPYPDLDQEIYSYERIVSADLRNESFEPKKIKVFMWRNS